MHQHQVRAVQRLLQIESRLIETRAAQVRIRLMEALDRIGAVLFDHVAHAPGFVRLEHVHCVAVLLQRGD